MLLVAYEMMEHVQRLAYGACLAGGLAVFTTSSVWAARAPIYKCFDKKLSLVYTDEPCKDGEQLDIRAGDSDPAAVAWLERQRDALDQSAAQRIIDQRRTAIAEELTPQVPYEPVVQGGSYGYAPTYTADYGFLPDGFMHRHPIRVRKAGLHHMRHFAPRPPFVVPRR